MSTQPIQLVPAAPVPVPSRREMLWVKEGRICHWCGCPTHLAADNSWDKATKDHVIPRYKGGSDEDDNLVSACSRCNSRRNHEDHKGMSEGEMLGKFKTSPEPVKPPSKPKFNEIDSMRADRDRILQELIRARDKIKVLEIAQEKRGQLVRYLQSEVAKKDDYIKSVSVWGFVKLRLVHYLLTSNKKSV